MINNRQKKKTIWVLILLLLIGIGYAYLHSSLSINGTTEIAGNTWNVHFENVVPLSSNTATVNTAPVANPVDKVTELTYSILFNKPGDFYEFNVDVVNEGTIDAMIDEFVSTIKIGDGEEQVLTSLSLPSYLNYSVTYEDGTEIEENHVLESSESETIKVHIEYKLNISSAELIDSSNKSIVFSIGLNYKQSDGSVTPSNPLYTAKYVVSDYTVTIGETIPPEVNARDTYQEALEDWVDISHNQAYIWQFYIRHNLNEDDEVIESYIGFIINDEYKEEWKNNCNEDLDCLEQVDNLINGVYEIKGGDPEAYEENEEIIKEAFNYSIQPDVCTEDDEQFRCGLDVISVFPSAMKNGKVNLWNGGGHHCDIETDGSSSCTFQ